MADELRRIRELLESLRQAVSQQRPTKGRPESRGRYLALGGPASPSRKHDPKLRSVNERRSVSTDDRIVDAEMALSRALRNKAALDLAHHKAIAEIKELGSVVQKREAQHAELQRMVEQLDRELAAYIEDIARYLDHLTYRGEQFLDETTFAAGLAAGRAVAERYRRSPIATILKGVSVPKRSGRSGRTLLFLHYLLGRRRSDANHLALMATSGLFDPDYYLETYEDVAKAGLDPLIHYVDFGAKEGRSPSALFDSQYYLKTNPDVADANFNPLLHFLLHGRDEGRRPRPLPVIKDIFGDWEIPRPPSLTHLLGHPPNPVPQKIVVYTAVAGGYDEIKTPLVQPANCDFVVFSDENISVPGWQVRPINYAHSDPTRAARFVKLHPHIFFPEYDHSIWIDGNISIKGDVRKFLEPLTYESFLGIFVHPLRDCIYVEAEECIKRKKDDPQEIRRHVERYRAAGYPKRAGLWETNIVSRRHNDPRCIALMNAWWREIVVGSRRDQLSLPVVVRRHGARIAPLGAHGANARSHRLVTLTQHPSKRPPSGENPPAIRKEVDVDRIPIDVGVCVHNSPAEVRACVESLIAARRPSDRILLVDDASDAPTASMLDDFARKHEFIEIIRHPVNRGYTHSANQVFQWAKTPWVVLLNSDTIVPERALPKLVACGEQFSQIGIVGPLSNAASWQTVPRLVGPDGKFMVNELPPGLSVSDMDRLCERESTGVPLFAPLINGFCLAIRRSLFEHVGLFDEKLFPMGYGEEDDFCLRAGEAGYMGAIATDAYIFHSKSASFTPERRVLLVEEGARALRTRHSPELIAASVNMLKRNPELERMRKRIEEKLTSITPQTADEPAVAVI